MALLSVLHQLRPVYNLTLTVAHVHHQLRGEEADRDATFVQQQAEQRALPFYQSHVDVKACQRASGLSPQHAARRLRYQALRALQQALGATHIALGHTADDQAETLLIRLLRGTGPAGLAGIPPVRVPFIRPLITMRRPAILAYLQAEGISWVEDSSNAHRQYLRNRLRLDLLPVLQQYNAQIVKRLTVLADMLYAENVVLEQHTDALAQQAVRWGPAQQVMLRCGPYHAAPLALQRRLLRRLVDALNASSAVVDFQQLETLRQFVAKGGAGKRLLLPGGIWAERHRESVWLWNPQQSPATTFTSPFPVPGSVTIPGFRGALVADIVENTAGLMQAGPHWAYTARERVCLPLQVRFPQPGDRFFPLGAPGRQKLQDFFVNSKIARAQRPYIPLVISGTEIVWVVGYRIAEPFKVRPETRQVLRLRCATPDEASS
jgi:tRNA(Ile)-lysidine synthase